MQCTVCKRHRLQLRPRKSKLKPNMQMFLCTECFDERREPRFLVILATRQAFKDHDTEALNFLRDYIRNRRYYGEKISAEELV